MQFAFLILQVLIVKRLFKVSEEFLKFGCLYRLETERLWTLLKMDRMNCTLWCGYRPMETREWNLVIWMRMNTHRLKYLKDWSPASGIFWDRLLGMLLLKYVWLWEDVCHSFSQFHASSFSRYKFYQIKQQTKRSKSYSLTIIA